MNTIDIDRLQTFYSLARTIRRFEEIAIAQYRLGHIRGYFHQYTGQEAVAVGAISAIRSDDYIVSTHRGHGHAIAKGHDIRRIMAELFGKETGYCRGRGGSMHVSNLAQQNLGANGIVGGGIPIATGAAMGIKLTHTDQVVLCFFSDGASNNGVFHESLNMAAIYNLPVIFVLENNQYAVSTPINEAARVEQLSIRAQSYAIPGCTVDGNDAVKVLEAMEEPVGRARSGEGPTLIECITFRRGGHHVNDPGLYMPEAEVASWTSRDPIDILRSYLLEAGLTEEEVQVVDARIEQEIEDAVQFAIESPEPALDEFLEEISTS